MIFRIIGLLAIIALVIFFIRYFRGYYSGKRRLSREGFDSELFQMPIEVIPKTQTFMNLPPIEAALAVEFFKKQYIPLKGDGSQYYTLFGDKKQYNSSQFNLVEEPYDIIVYKGYGQLWQALIDLPKNKYHCQYIIIGNAQSLEDRYRISVAELEKKDSPKN